MLINKKMHSVEFQAHGEEIILKKFKRELQGGLVPRQLTTKHEAKVVLCDDLFYNNIALDIRQAICYFMDDNSQRQMFSFSLSTDLPNPDLWLADLPGCLHL